MLCTVEDVAFEGAFELTPGLKDKIEYKIRNISEYMRRISHRDLDSVPYKFYATMACTYSVLMWLESKNLIFPSQVASVREGDITLIYKMSEGMGASSKVQPPSYKELYDHYMGFILPLPPVGASI